MTIGLGKEATTCSMLPDGDEARHKQKNVKKNPISGGGGSRVPAMVFGRKCLRREPLAGGIRMHQVRAEVYEGLLDNIGLGYTDSEGPTYEELYTADPKGRWKRRNFWSHHNM